MGTSELQFVERIVELPYTSHQKQTKHRTAALIVKRGCKKEMEIFNQRGQDPQFAFMSSNGRFNEYYEFIINAIEDGKMSTEIDFDEIQLDRNISIGSSPESSPDMYIVNVPLEFMRRLINGDNESTSAVTTLPDGLKPVPTDRSTLAEVNQVPRIQKIQLAALSTGIICLAAKKLRHLYICEELRWLSQNERNSKRCISDIKSVRGPILISLDSSALLAIQKCYISSFIQFVHFVYEKLGIQI